MSPVFVNQKLYFVKHNLKTYKICESSGIVVSVLVAESSEHIKDFPLSTHTVIIRYLRPEFKFTAKIEMVFSQIIAIR